MVICRKFYSCKCNYDIQTFTLEFKPTGTSCLVGRVISTRAYGSGDRGSIPRAGRTHIVFSKRLKTVEAVLEHDVN